MPGPLETALLPPLGLLRAGAGGSLRILPTMLCRAGAQCPGRGTGWRDVLTQDGPVCLSSPSLTHLPGSTPSIGTDTGKACLLTGKAQPPGRGRWQGWCGVACSSGPGLRAQAGAWLRSPFPTVQLGLPFLRGKLSPPRARLAPRTGLPQRLAPPGQEECTILGGRRCETSSWCRGRSH